MAKARKKSGLGDIIATVTDAVGIEPCEGCEKRKSLLNIHFAFGRPTPLTQEQRERMFEDPLGVYNESFNQNIEKEQFKGGVEKAILKKLTKLKDYEN